MYVEAVGPLSSARSLPIEREIQGSIPDPDNHFYLVETCSMVYTE